MDPDYKLIAQKKSEEQKETIYVVSSDGSYQYLTGSDDFTWDDVVFVAKTF